MGTRIGTGLRDSSVFNIAQGLIEIVTSLEAPRPLILRTAFATWKVIWVPPALTVVPELSLTSVQAAAPHTSAPRVLGGAAVLSGAAVQAATTTAMTTQALDLTAAAYPMPV